MKTKIEELINTYSKKANLYLKKAKEYEDHILSNECMQMYYTYQDIVDDLKKLAR